MTAILDKSSSLGILHAGLAFRMVAQIKVDGSPRPLTNSTLTAQVLSRDHERAHTAPVELNPAAPAAWATGSVVVQIPATETVKVPVGDADLAIYETDSAGDKWGYFMPLRAVQGLPNG